MAGRFEGLSASYLKINWTDLINFIINSEWSCSQLPRKIHVDVTLVIRGKC